MISHSVGRCNIIGMSIRKRQKQDQIDYYKYNASKNSIVMKY